MLCFITCILNYVAFVVGWITLIIVTLKVVLGPKTFKTLRDKAFAYFMEYYAKEGFQTALQQSKTELFSSMKLLKSSDEKLAKTKALNILEVS